MTGNLNDKIIEIKNDLVNAELRTKTWKARLLCWRGRQHWSWWKPCSRP